MIKKTDGAFILELEDELSSITIDKSIHGSVTENQFKDALKNFNLRESLEILASVSNKIGSGELDEQWERLGGNLIRNKVTNLYIHQNAIEYVINLFIISEANDSKTHSLKAKDNLIGLFNIYNNCLPSAPTDTGNILSMMIFMWQEQLRSQFKYTQTFGRVICFFEQNSKLKLVGDKTLDDIFLEITGLTLEDYLNIGLILFAFAMQNPRVTIADLGQENEDFSKIINNESLKIFLRTKATDLVELREIDKKENQNLNIKNTKNRLNPLWIKPIILYSEIDYLIPSITAYVQSIFNGLYWWFDDLFINQKYSANLPIDTFRNCFGKQIFEPYVGILLKDIYQEKNVTDEIKYCKNQKAFTDWVVIDGDDAYLFEVKAYQFPFKTLQSGDLELIAKEITKKLVQDTISKINKKLPDIDTAPELSFLKGKNLIPVIVTYNVPLIDTTMYRQNIETIVDEDTYKIFKDFNGYFLNISDIEMFKCTSSVVKLKDIFLLVQKNNSNFQAEVVKIYKQENLKEKTFPEKIYEEKLEYIERMIRPRR